MFCGLKIKPAAETVLFVLCLSPTLGALIGGGGAFLMFEEMNYTSNPLIPSVIGGAVGFGVFMLGGVCCHGPSDLWKQIKSCFSPEAPQGELVVTFLYGVTVQMVGATAETSNS